MDRSGWKIMSQTLSFLAGLGILAFISRVIYPFQGWSIRSFFTLIFASNTKQDVWLVGGSHVGAVTPGSRGASRTVLSGLFTLHLLEHMVMSLDRLIDRPRLCLSVCLTFISACFSPLCPYTTFSTVSYTSEKFTSLQNQYPCMFVWCCIQVPSPRPRHPSHELGDEWHHLADSWICPPQKKNPPASFQICVSTIDCNSTGNECK